MKTDIDRGDKQMGYRLKHTIIFFFFSFLWTWAFYCAIIFLGLNPYQGAGMGLLICGGCSPTFVGLIMVMLTFQKEQKLEYLKRIYQGRRIKLQWWLLILLFFPVVFAVSIGLDVVLGGSLPEMLKLKAVIASPLSFFSLILLSFMSGPFSEELGWRGFALDQILSHYGFTKASVLLGLAWGVWHLPLYFMPQTWHGQMGFRFTGFWVFIFFSIGLSIIMSWVYINTKRSILAAILIHLFSNFSGQLLDPLSPNVVLIKGLIILTTGVGIAVYKIVTKKDAVIEIYDPRSFR